MKKDTDAPRQRQTSGDSGGAATMVAATNAESAPMLRIVSQDATPEEIAAIVALFSAMGGGGTTTPAPTPLWSSVARRIGVTRVPGPGTWRASGLPR